LPHAYDRREIGDPDIGGLEVRNAFGKIQLVAEPVENLPDRVGALVQSVEIAHRPDLNR